jgi:mRNA-decapping enzyme 1B
MQNLTVDRRRTIVTAAKTQYGTVPVAQLQSLAHARQSNTHSASLYVSPPSSLRLQHSVATHNQLVMAFTLSDEARKEANLRVLQRQDKSVDDILCSATHVVLYEFSASQWQKLDIEGSLFLVKRRQMPRFQLSVLNRNSTDNYCVDISATFQVQNKDPYLMFRKPDNSIQGIWFHNGPEREQVAALLQKVVKSLQVDPDAAAQALASVSLGGNNGAEPPTPPMHRPSPQSTPPCPRTTSQQTSPVLDKKSLQLALLSLLHDDRFLDLIHAQYLKVAHARANRKPDES